MTDIEALLIVVYALQAAGGAGFPASCNLLPLISGRLVGLRWGRSGSR
jgi:hypothetical protein